MRIDIRNIPISDFKEVYSEIIKLLEVKGFKDTEATFIYDYTDKVVGYYIEIL